MMRIGKKFLGITKKLGITNISENDKRLAQSHLRKGMAKMQIMGDKFNTNFDLCRNAIESFTEAIILNPTLIEGYYLRANCKRRSFEYQSAINDLNEVIELDPENIKAYCSRGWAKYERESHKSKPGEYVNWLSEKADSAIEKALIDFDEAIIINPLNVDSLWERYKLYSILGGKYKYERLRDLNTIIKLKSDFGEAYYYRAEIKRFQIKSTDINDMASDYYNAHIYGERLAVSNLEKYCRGTEYWENLPYETKELAIAVNKMK